ncbi:putative acetyl xylan esterase (Axe1) [Aspergillus lucknowensis]|uniref:Cutinase n=1 Tax=Aspergillus lucknowensis TaxID=176173 RepID=A0ABR4LED4_9EURO
MHWSTLTLLFLASRGMAKDFKVEKRQSCPQIHVFGARETTAAPGFGSSSYVVDAVLSAYSGATSEAIDYPACGGDASCGGASYGQSVAAGIEAVGTAVNGFNSQCPDAQIVLVGYSQGGEIFDAALCGGGVPNQGIADNGVVLSESAVAQVKAAIFMGDPLYSAGLPYNVGTCSAGGFDARPSGFSCPSASVIQSYCDSADPYCCNGNDANTHNGYGQEYGQQALQFIQSQLG